MSASCFRHPADGELRIEILRYQWVRYEGTAAQLQAEGLVADGFQWPRAAASERWSAGGFDYCLRRTRPSGHKGPMRSWLEIDNWVIFVEVTGRDLHWHTRRALERKAEELEALRRQGTGDFQREWDAMMGRYHKACDDKSFQAFKRLVPGLVAPTRGRKPAAIVHASASLARESGHG